MSVPSGEFIKHPELLHYYRSPGFPEPIQERLTRYIKDAIPRVASLETEYCFNLELKGGGPMTADEFKIFTWLISETFEPNMTAGASFLDQVAAKDGKDHPIIEVGPRMTFTTAWSSNAVSICQACGLDRVTRIERSRRFRLHLSPGNGGSTSTSGNTLSEEEMSSLLRIVHDRMTEEVYSEPLRQFTVGPAPKPWTTVPVLQGGRPALEEVNQRMGLGFDDWDLDYYTNLFQTKLGRDPTDVEVFDIGQSNSEHSRHWFFGGRIVIDGAEMPKTLFQMVKSTLTPEAKRNSIIAFHDNSSVIRGFSTRTAKPSHPGHPSALVEEDITLNPLLTAETHNFPCAVAPFPGAETGTGGRLRDVQATGRGAHTVAGISSYCVGNLHIPSHPLPWEDPSFVYPPNLATPLQIEIEASNGASDYGNKFGEPVVCGFTRSFGQRLANGERHEYIKPIMFSAGVGMLDKRHGKKGDPAGGMVVVKVGGPAYRIGIGGGAASSRVQGSATAKLDFDAVQRGDAEMENKMNRLIRACVELGDNNPIVSIHDQGAGGNGNVLKEIVEPLGAKYDVRKIPVGDETLSVLEIWGAEYQENNAFLIRPADKELVATLAAREKCPVAFLGEVATDGKVVLYDSKDQAAQAAVAAASSEGPASAPPTAVNPVDLPLDLVLAALPPKTFPMERNPPTNAFTKPLSLPPALTVPDALDRVLKLVQVGSKRFLTTKVDRSVTGLIAQQQCVGPLHLPLADCAVVAQSMLAHTGTATAVGEQPIKGLVCPRAMARMVIAEAMTNVVWAKIGAGEGGEQTLARALIKASGNWMWAAKLKGEGPRMYDACESLCSALLCTAISIDGGKDSLSMAAQAGGETVKSPGTLTMTVYAPCPDVTLTVTPDLKLHGARLASPSGPGGDGGEGEGEKAAGVLILVDLGGGRARLGGSALAQVYGQLGSDAPNMGTYPNKDHNLDPAERSRIEHGAFAHLNHAFDTTQELLTRRLLSAGHDRSDGGLLVTVLEMAFGGHCGLDLDVPLPYGRSRGEVAAECEDGREATDAAELAVLFSEEAGLVVEVHPDHVQEVLAAYNSYSGAPTGAAVPLAAVIGRVRPAGYQVTIAVDGRRVLEGDIRDFRSTWESTSFALERYQTNPACVDTELQHRKERTGPQYRLTFDPKTSPMASLGGSTPPTPPAWRPRVAVLRQEGSNGDREMGLAFHRAGFEAWDINVSDLVEGRIILAGPNAGPAQGHPAYNAAAAAAASDASSFSSSMPMPYFHGLVFVGGFSYADVLDSAKGWAGVLKFHPEVYDQLVEFYRRTDTFSLGVCNGCQLMALLGVVPENRVARTAAGAVAEATAVAEADLTQPRLLENRSGRFESRYSAVKIEENTAAMMLQGMGGSTLGVWVAHGEGRFHFPGKGAQQGADQLDSVLSRGLAPIRYVDDSNAPTERYPENPNGSPHGIAALCSPDGRHLAMMPHPERCFLEWQQPYLPPQWGAAAASGQEPAPGPWLRMFQNARLFCEQVKKA